MYYNISSHKSSVGNSSSIDVINYLEKENKLPKDEGLFIKESFFDSNFDTDNTEQNINTSDIVLALDNNRGTQNYTSSNFYMMNISPSPNELKHMEKIAIETLKEKNISIDNNPPASTIYYNEQKDQLMKLQIKFYIKDVMLEYADNFNREIFVDESKLPTNEENKKLNAETDIFYNKFLESQNIILSNDKIEKVENDKFITYNNCKIISENTKSKEIEITLENNKKGIVNIPNNMVFLQKDNSVKILESVYNDKIKEVENKNIEKQIDYKFTKSDTILINKSETKVYNFELKDERFKEPLKFSIQEKDLKIKDGKYFITQHLNNEKVNYSIKKAVEKEFSQYREKIYNDLGTKKGFDFTKRPLTEKDLLWYAKVEKNRTYKHTDVSVKHNREVNKKIAQLQKSPVLNSIKIEKLKNSLILDKDTKEVIKEGNQKGGLQYHSHVVISRHDKTMQNPRNKISLSPVANQKESLMNNGAKVGFDRKNFAEKIEKVFDAKFEYDRSEKEKFNTINNKALNMTKAKAKQFLMKHTGINEIKANISPLQSIKKEIGISNIPTQIPKGIVDLAVKVVKKIISKSQGIGY
ncbi:DUF5712 family protein [Flavobacterium psychrophilum]|uniref:DUF5712 family protein n=1 Tax=Flavobacterium psychrophilum TaxID=96345 RepID=UPI00106A06E6|nr:DUF5712 family protein [Flavobacterium psychrophilum]